MGKGAPRIPLADVEVVLCKASSDSPRQGEEAEMTDKQLYYQTPRSLPYWGNPTKTGAGYRLLRTSTALKAVEVKLGA